MLGKCFKVVVCSIFFLALITPQNVFATDYGKNEDFLKLTQNEIKVLVGELPDIEEMYNVYKGNLSPTTELNLSENISTQSTTFETVGEGKTEVSLDRNKSFKSTGTTKGKKITAANSVQTSVIRIGEEEEFLGSSDVGYSVGKFSTSREYEVTPEGFAFYEGFTQHTTTWMGNIYFGYTGDSKLNF